MCEWLTDCCNRCTFHTRQNFKSRQNRSWSSQRHTNGVRGYAERSGKLQLLLFAHRCTYQALPYKLNTRHSCTAASTICITSHVIRIAHLAPIARDNTALFRSDQKRFKVGRLNCLFYTFGDLLLRHVLSPSLTLRSLHRSEGLIINTKCLSPTHSHT